MQLSYPLHTELASSNASHKLEHKQIVSRNVFGVEEKSAKSHRGETAMIADHTSVDFAVGTDCAFGLNHISWR